MSTEFRLELSLHKSAAYILGFRSKTIRTGTCGIGGSAGQEPSHMLNKDKTLYKVKHLPVYHIKFKLSLFLSLTMYSCCRRDEPDWDCVTETA